MLTNNTEITVFCSRKSGRETQWIKHIISNVNLHGSGKLVNGGREAVKSEEYTVRIPYSELSRYVSPKIWETLGDNIAGFYFTLKSGDYIVKGRVNEAVSTSADILKNPSALKIVSVTENFSSSEYSKHIKLVVK